MPLRNLPGDLRKLVVADPSGSRSFGARDAEPVQFAHEVAGRIDLVVERELGPFASVA
jgi:hypothetical protein